MACPSPNPPPGLPNGAIAALATAAGLAVGNITFAEPLLPVIGRSLGIDDSALGLVGAVIQVGYAAGLLLILPLGDFLDMKRLILAQLGMAACSLLLVGLSSNAALFFCAIAAVGMMAVVAQVIVAATTTLALPAARGGALGTVSSGIIVGILLARVVSGAFSDLLGWRSIYFASCIATILAACWVAAVMPAPQRARRSASYRQLVSSVVGLVIRDPDLRLRGLLALLVFGANMVLWTPLVFPLTAAPFHLSSTQVGAFGLAGVMGAVGASMAGKWADRGLAHRTTTLGLSLMLFSWVPVSLLHLSLAGVGLGAVMMTFGLQSVHVSSQSSIYRRFPEARSRAVAAYMLFYACGSALGASFSTLVYGFGGWTAVCATGVSIDAAACLLWLKIRSTRTEDATSYG